MTKLQRRGVNQQALPTRRLCFERLYQAYLTSGSDLIITSPVISSLNTTSTSRSSSNKESNKVEAMIGLDDTGRQRLLSASFSVDEIYDKVQLGRIVTERTFVMHELLRDKVEAQPSLKAL
jgi:hypothetical protein